MAYFQVQPESRFFLDLWKCAHDSHLNSGSEHAFRSSNSCVQADHEKHSRVASVKKTTEIVPNAGGSARLPPSPTCLSCFSSTCYLLRGVFQIFNSFIKQVPRPHGAERVQVSFPGAEFQNGSQIAGTHSLCTRSVPYFEMLYCAFRSGTCGTLLSQYSFTTVTRSEWSHCVCSAPIFVCV